MDPAVFAEILARLDLVVFERQPDGEFVRIGIANPPEWYSRMFQHAVDTSFPVASVFLEGFLSAAEAAWRKGDPGRLRSDAITLTDPEGGEIGLVASAFAVEDRRFLVLESSADFDERRRTLQVARERALAYDDHVRRTGALMTPVKEARKVLQELADDSGLTAEQKRLASQLRERLDSMAAAIEALAPVPKGVVRGGR